MRGVRRRGEPLAPSLVREPLSREGYKQLGLGSVRAWQRLDVPFDQIRQIT
jgi:hypothetical protein